MKYDRKLVLGTACAAAVLVAARAGAADFTWTGASPATPDVNDGRNFVGGVAPATVAPDANVIFSSAATAPENQHAPNFAADTSWRSLRFTGDALFWLRTSGGHGLTLTDGITNASTYNQLVSIPIILGAAGTVTVGAAGLAFSGYGRIDTNGHALYLSGGGTLTAPIRGSGPLNVFSGSRATLSGDSTYTGVTFVYDRSSLTLANGSMNGSNLDAATHSRFTVGAGGRFGPATGTGTNTITLGGITGVDAGHVTLLTGGTVNTLRTLVGQNLGNGYSAGGTFTQSGGTHRTERLHVASTNGWNPAAYDLGAGTLTAATETIGAGATFRQAGGTHAVTGALSVDGATRDGALAAAFHLSGGTLAAAALTAADARFGTFRQTGGTAEVGSVYLGFAAGGDGTYTLGGGTLSALSVTSIGGRGTFNFDGGTLAARANLSLFPQGSVSLVVQDGGARIDTAGFDASITKVIGHDATLGATRDGGLTKAGAGSLAVTAANTYTGPTTVNAGTLMANNTTGSATGPGAVTVNAGATLGGNGSVAGAVTASGTIAPGTAAAAGRLSTGGAVTLSGTGAVLRTNLGGTTPGRRRPRPARRRRRGDARRGAERRPRQRPHAGDAADPRRRGRRRLQGRDRLGRQRARSRPRRAWTTPTPPRPAGCCSCGSTRPT